MGNAICCCPKQEPMPHEDHHAFADHEKNHELPQIRLPILKAKSKKNAEGKKTGLENINDAFSDYINRAKIKIRTTTNNIDGEKSGALQEGKVGDHKKKENDGSRDIFSDYINRAKVKIRKTSSIGSSKK